MSDIEKPKPGTIAWTDLTVEDADKIRDFYSKVTGWKPEPVAMGDYQDFNMTLAGSGEPVAGICHARGGNREIPASWMIYIVVEDLEQSVARVRELGGEVLVAPRGSQARFCIIRDPAGAVAALYQTGN
jgi:predicted enzyme related to lactoylglutathione lyase